ARDLGGGGGARPAAGPRLVGGPRGDEGARHRPRRVDLEPAGLAMEPRALRSQPGFEAVRDRHPWLVRLVPFACTIWGGNKEGRGGGGACSTAPRSARRGR